MAADRESSGNKSESSGETPSEDEKKKEEKN